jgi:uncharacterized protein (DUF433 family)
LVIFLGYDYYTTCCIIIKITKKQRQKMIDQSLLYENETYQVLNAPSYPIAEASRLVGISNGRIARWLRGYEYTYEVASGTEIRGGSQEPVVQRTVSEESSYVTFLELIDLLYVKKFLDKNFSLYHIRKLLNDARKYTNIPHFASSRFLAYGNKIFLDQKKSSKGSNLIALLTGGQFAFREIIEQIGDKIDFENITGYELASRLYPLGKNGDIVIDPRISFGKPTIIGYRITTSNIYDTFLGENKEIKNISKWYKIPAGKIASAVRFETSLVA